MTKKPKMQYRHKRTGKGMSISARAVHSSDKVGRPVVNPVKGVSRAQEFMSKLKVEIRRSQEKSPDQDI